MDIFFSARPLSLFQVFALCFAAPSFAYFQSYLWALMVVEGRKCMTRLACCAFFHQRDLSSWERFLAGHRWSLRAVTEHLLRLVVERLGDLVYRFARPWSDGTTFLMILSSPLLMRLSRPPYALLRGAPLTPRGGVNAGGRGRGLPRVFSGVALPG